MSPALTTETLLKIAATGFTGIFAGSATYITFVQHPAVVATDELAVQVPFFREMYQRATRMQASLAVLGGASALLAHYLDRRAALTLSVSLSSGSEAASTSMSGSEAASTSMSTSMWLVGGTLMVAIVPYTIVTMLSLNHQLMDSTRCFAKGKVWVHTSLARWVKLHNVRTGASVAAFAFMLMGLARTNSSAHSAQ
ncbi:hypothetical protein PybrP1_009834 [[Pythium] brassicae (nom. inval.)]|nr:hypothetical protein PybrP1_009834 [[Pythium] brassicae (nom. inval.)]